MTDKSKLSQKSMRTSAAFVTEDAITLGEYVAFSK